jgi:SAM-dependent methyltransferase
VVDLTNTFEFRGYRIPHELALLTGGGGDTFSIISDAHMRCLRRDADIQANHHILEIGCGIGRDAIPLSEFLSPVGSYIGIDIVKPSIDWCTENITSKHSSFRFVHFDIKEPLHNPHGTITSQAVSFPLPSASIDRIILWSVFTHMVPEDMAHYFREFRRLLRPDGLIYATCFILDDDTLAKARTSAPTAWSLTFSHEYRRGVYLQDAACPTYAVGYNPVSLAEMIATSDLKLARFIRGNWCGLHAGEAGQDVMILRLPLRARVARTVLRMFPRH